VMFALLAGRPPFRAKTMPEMLQLQRFAEPEPVRRYAPQTPEELDRLIGQLLSKEPADRFPNVLVLGRHMEAMQRALSRPSKPSGNGDANLGEQASARLESTAVFNADATLAPEDLSITPSETTDSGVYNAPTLADDGQLQLEEPAPAPSGTSGSLAATVKSKLPKPVPASRFTTVEEAERLAREQQSHRWAVVFQLLLLVATLAGLGWLGWRLARPASADDVYATIADHVEEKGEKDLAPIAEDIDDFLQRFPNDPRSEEIRSYAKELELQKRERQLRVRARLTGNIEAHPIAEVFAEAMKLRDANPAQAAAMLENLLALYPQAGPDSSALNDDQRTYLTLAQRELAELRSVLDKRAGEQLPVLKERLLAAERLEKTAPDKAVAMYRALTDLYGEQAWASAVVDEARARLQTLDAK
jgi:eukaryotic-like serine/threonine-protein kinase